MVTQSEELITRKTVVGIQEDMKTYLNGLRMPTGWKIVFSGPYKVNGVQRLNGKGEILHILIIEQGW